MVGYTEGRFGMDIIVRSIEASKYVQMPFSRFRKTNTKKRYKHIVKPISKSEKSKEYTGNAFRKFK